jgi:anti-sigma-K factor RskA
MNCADFKAVAASFALGACNDEERVAAEAHLREASHDGCMEALREASEGAALLAKIDPPLRPDPVLWERLAAEAFGEAAPELPQKRAPVPLWAYGGWIAAAAVLVVFALLLAAERRQIAEGERLLAAVGHPAAEIVALVPQTEVAARAAVNAVLNRQTKTALLTARGLRTPPGKDYELWVIRGEQKIPAGILRTRDGSLLMEIDAALLREKIDALAITLEPRGGGAVPTGPVLWLGAPKAL